MPATPTIPVSSIRVRCANGNSVGAELVVHAHPNHTEVLPIATVVNAKLARRNRCAGVGNADHLAADKAGVVVPLTFEGDVQTFDLGRPVESERPFDTAAHGPADVVVVAIAE